MLAGTSLYPLHRPSRLIFEKIQILFLYTITLSNFFYLEDFFKPKVMWKIIGCNINFSFDDGTMICNNAVDIMTGQRKQLLQFLGLMNS